VLTAINAGAAGNISITNAGAVAFVADNDANGGSIQLVNTGGNLTVAAGNVVSTNGNVTLQTAGAGNIVLTGAVTAGTATAALGSAGDINGAGAITAATIDLDAVSGIGNAGALQLSGTA